MRRLRMRCRAVVFSLLDPVSRGVFELAMLELKPKPKLEFRDYTIYTLSSQGVLVVSRDRDILYLDDLPDALHGVCTLEEALFVSRHSMRNPRPMITVHPTGNWRDAPLGGRPSEISMCNPHTVTGLFRLANRLKVDYGLHSFECSIEATHHGPTITSVPVTFVELGSTEAEWGLRRGWELILELAKIFLTGSLGSSAEPAISIGDLHYTTLTERLLAGEADLGHSIPKYQLPLTEDMIKRAVRLMSDRPVKAYVSWKALSREDREVVERVLSIEGVRLVKRT